MKPESESWVRTARGHLESADLLYRAAHYPQSVFFYEQAIECLLKSAWIESHREGVQPKVHDLVDLAKQLPQDFDEAQLEFLRKLQDQYTPTRYADVAVEYDQETAEFYRDSSRQMFEWLLHKLK